ncbi:MAG TPA: glycosyltransferase family 4 protein [Solirubrobacterales bacterium]|nr:glycosyltransferase family 4 protein [Solirubrobacterales bacterium]
MRRLREKLHAVRWRLRATRRLWSPGTRPGMPILEPEEKLAGGRFDLRPGAILPAAETTLSGWALFAAGPPLRVELKLGDEPLGKARLGLPRPDVGEALQLGPGAVTGFELRVDLGQERFQGAAKELRATVTGPFGDKLEIGPTAVSVAAPERSAPPERLARPAPIRRQGLRTLVVAHELGLGGAQLYLLDLIGELLRTETVDPLVVSAVDGPLRSVLEASGVPVHVSGEPPRESLAAHRGRVEELVAWIGERELDVAFVNTATGLTLPGVEAARELGLPVLWAVHESFEPATLWAGLDPAIRRRGETLLAEAETTLFVAKATQRLFGEAVAHNGRTIPYGIDLAPIEAAREGFDRAGTRHRFGIPAEAEVILSVGTIEPRKGQVALAQAFELVAARHRDARLVFVGGRADADTRFLAEHAAGLGAAERIHVVPLTPDVQPWFGIADVFACASDVESMPRTVLEAMAWEKPVLATAVFGLPEVIEDGRNGWLCEARDVATLAAALERALDSDDEERRRLGREGRALVERRHRLPEYGRQVASLLVGLGDAGAERARWTARLAGSGLS